MSIAGAPAGLGHTVGITASNGFNGEWDDLQGPVSQAAGASSLRFEQYRDAPFNAFFYEYTGTDTLYYTFQLSHTWQRGTAAHLHVHYTPMSTWVAPPATRRVIIEVAYCWTISGEVVPGAAGWTTVTCNIDLVPTDQYKILLTELVDPVPPANAKESSLLLCRIRRLGTDPGDTYDVAKDHGTPAANVAVWDHDCHYQRDKAGTPQEYPV